MSTTTFEDPNHCQRCSVELTRGPAGRYSYRQHRLEALLFQIEHELDQCLAWTRAELLTGLRFRERNGEIIVDPILSTDAEAVAEALRQAGFQVKLEGMNLTARRSR